MLDRKDAASMIRVLTLRKELNLFLSLFQLLLLELESGGAFFLKELHLCLNGAKQSLVSYLRPCIAPLSPIIPSRGPPIIRLSVVSRRSWVTSFRTRGTGSADIIGLKVT